MLALCSRFALVKWEELSSKLCVLCWDLGQKPFACSVDYFEVASLDEPLW